MARLPSWVMVALAPLLTMLLASTKPAEMLEDEGAAAAGAAGVPAAGVVVSSAGAVANAEATSFLISERISASLLAVTAMAPAEFTSVL